MANAPVTAGARPAARGGSERPTRWLGAVARAIGLTLMAGVVYVVAVGTSAGRRLDTRAIVDPGTGRSWAFDRTVTSDLGHVVAAASFVLFAAAVLLIALRRLGGRHATLTLLVIGAAAVSAQLLKGTLADVDVVGGVAERRIGASFPSGHAAVAMSLALALVRIAPASWRAPAALVAVAYASAVGVALVLFCWHYPSDVVGGYLVAGAWAAAAPLHPRRVGRRHAAASRRLRSAGVAMSGASAGMLLGALVGGFALPVLAGLHNAPPRPVPGGFPEAAVSLALCAAAVIAITGRSPRS